MIRSSYTAVILSLLTTISALPLPAQAGDPKPVGKQNAEQLLRSAQESLAYTTKAARNAGEKLSPENASAKPFLLSLKKVNSALDEAGKGLTEKKPEFFKSLDAARSAVAEMQATWDLTGSDDKNVIAGAKKLGGDIIALHENYSPVAARRAKGGELTAQEKAKFAKIQGQQAALDKKLAALAAKYTNNKALAAGVKQIRSKANRIAKSKPSVASYTGAVDLLSAIAGMISGYSYYVPAAARSEWVAIETLSSNWSYQSVYEEYSYEWSSTEESVEVYDSESIEVSESEMTEEDSYLEETEFNMSDTEENEVAEESDDIAADEISDDDLESDQEEVEQAEDEEDMAPADDSADEADDSAADDASGGGDDGGDDAGGGGGDDGGDDAGGDDGGSDDGGGDSGGGDDGGGE